MRRAGRSCRAIARALSAVLVAGLVTPAPAAEPAKQLFGAQKTPAALPPAAHGSYARGCLAGGVELPETAERWQAMRLSRNRNWGHPLAIAFIERLSERVRALGWAGLYVGDISQPRGGPMISGHRSHQMGLDIDIWMRPKTEGALTRAAREEISSHRVVSGDFVNQYWSPSHGRVLRVAAEDQAVARIFVHAAIKRALCEAAPADDRAWLRKIRPWYGHDAHFHVRLNCPEGSAACTPQPPVPAGDGCDETLAWWFTDEAKNPKPGPKPPELTLADLPSACAAVLAQ